MKHFLIILSMLAAFSIKVDAQAPNLTWTRTHTELVKNSAGYSNSLCATSDGGFIFIGRTEDTIEPYSGYGMYEIYVVKTDADGDEEWSHFLGGSGEEKANAVFQTSDGEYIVAGWSNSTNYDVVGNHGEVDAWVLRLGTAGNIIWKKCFGGTEDEFLWGATPTADGGIVFAAYANSDNGDLSSLGNDDDPDGDTWIVKLTSSGNISWQRRLSNDLDLYNESFISTQDGGFAYAVLEDGYVNIVKRDELGNPDGIFISPEPFISASLVAMCQGTNGDYVVIVNRGSGFSPADGYCRYMAFDSTGNFLWEKNIDSEYYDEGESVKPMANGGYLLTSWNTGTGTTVHAIDNMGNIQWQKPVSTDYARIALELPNNQYVVLGGNSSNSNSETTSITISKWGPPTLSIADNIGPPNFNSCQGGIGSVYFLDNAGAGSSYCEVELSDVNGNFDNATVIGSGTESPIEITTPIGMPYGNGYRLRITKPQQGLLGEPFWNTFQIDPFYSNLFAETMGTVAGNVTVAAHESANGFVYDNLTMTGTATMSNNTSSAGDYSGASGGANVNLGTNNGIFFEIAGINTLDVTDLSLSCGIYKSSLFGLSTDMTISVSTDGINYTNLSYGLSIFSSGWELEFLSGNIPQAENLRIKFTRNNTNGGVTYRIDDVKLSGTINNLTIGASGPVNWCGVGSVTLTAPNSMSYLWSNGSTNQSIVVNTAGNYSCTITSLSDCSIELEEIQVTTTQQTFYSDLDADGYGGASAQLCAPNATYTILVGGDCDDENASINPAGIEICNGLDDDCDSEIDENLDKDGDGYASCNGDCDDNNPYIHPGAIDIQNGMDDNCDGLVDNPVQNTWYQDADSDGYGNPLHVSNLVNMPVGYVSNAIDCDDDDASRNPFAPDDCFDNIDNNCDGVVDNCAPSTCVGDLDNSGNVNITDLLIFLGVFGSSCN